MAGSAVTDDMVEGGTHTCGCPWFYSPEYPDEGYVVEHDHGCPAVDEELEDEED